MIIKNKTVDTFKKETNYLYIFILNKRNLNLKQIKKILKTIKKFKRLSRKKGTSKFS